MTKIIKSVVPAVIVLSIFLCALVPISDLDFWWHLKTGEWIVEHGELPKEDPFSYTAFGIDRDIPFWQELILKQYWLGQIAFAAVVKAFGLKGFIILRAFVFALIALIVLKIQALRPAVCSRPSEASELRTSNYNRPYATRYTLLFLLALIMTESFTDRPQMFSFLFAVLLLYLLERYRSSEWGVRSSETGTASYTLHATRYTLYAIPFLMLLWSQIHAGYVVGIAYLLVYLVTLPFEGPREAGTGSGQRMAEEEAFSVQRIAGREESPVSYRLNAKRCAVQAFVIIISILVTYLNPTHWQGIWAVFHLYGGTMFREATPVEAVEFLSPVTILPIVKISPGRVAYWVLIGSSLIATVPLIKRRSWKRLMILSGTALASLISMRYTSFFAPAAVVIIPTAFSSRKSEVTGQRSQVTGKRPQDQLTPVTRYLSPVVLLLVLAFTIIFIYHRVNFRGLLKSEIAAGYFPVQASEHILSAGIPQPVFNDINWGGFLIYRLWPEYKVFVDTRTLYPDMYRQYMNVLNYTQQGRDILRVYSIKSIITPAINPYTGEIFPLVRGLMSDDNWALIYLDGVAMIFVKKEYALQALPKTEIYRQVFEEVMFWAPSFPGAPGYGKTMEEVRSAFQKG